MDFNNSYFNKNLLIRKLVGLIYIIKFVLSMSNILITGATGHIGCWLVNHFLKKGHGIIAHGSSVESINNLKTRSNLNSKPNVKYWTQDFLANQWNFPNFANIDIIIHCAAATKVREGTIDNFERYFSLNVLATKLIAKKALENSVKHFIYFSSGQVYGISPSFPIREDTEKKPINLYGFTKLMGENIIKSLGILGLNYTTFRPFSVYGKGHDNIISIIKNKILNDEKITVYGDGNQKRAFTHVRDLCNALELIINNKQCFSQEYNFSGIKEYSVNDLIKMISKRLNKIPHIETSNIEIKEQQRNIANINKLKDLGFNFRQTLENFIENELN